MLYINYYYERYEEFITGSRGGISSEDETYEWYKTGYYDERHIRIDKRCGDWDLENKIRITSKEGDDNINPSKPQLRAICDLVKKYHEIKEKKNEKPTKSVKSIKLNLNIYNSKNN